MNHIAQFVDQIRQLLEVEKFVGLQISNKRNPDSDLKTILIKPVVLKKGHHLSFVYRHQTKDITKNYPYSESQILIEELLKNDFYQASLNAANEDIFLTTKQDGSGTIKRKPIEGSREVDHDHDHKKNRLISHSRRFLYALGITGHDGIIKKDKQAKYRQINKYLELLQDAMKTVQLPNRYHITDMGSGKGYLTFALYDYLKNNLKHDVTVTGIEMRKDLVTLCNQIAKDCEFDGLKFSKGTIQENKVKKMNILVALHACDTATDDAIAKGIQSGAEMIVCSPCCHKQIRKQLNPSGVLNKITQFGILKERQAELITDTIRAMIMQAHGYQTKVIEYISTEHTPKNLLIIGVKKKDATLDESVLKEIQELKAMYGIEYHYLETVLG